MLVILLSTLSVIKHLKLCKQLELASEIESDLEDRRHLGLGQEVAC